MPIGTAEQGYCCAFWKIASCARLGSKSGKTSVDVRVLAATNKELPEDAVAARPACENDLYYRLNVFNIQLPPLRERQDDLPALVQALLAGL